MAPKAGSFEVLNALRENLKAEGLAAIVIPSEDAHQSEYVPLKDRRREYVSGFTGSAGTAVITMQKALLWTDGRYFLQANKELGPEWTLMKALEKDVPNVDKWLADNLDKGSTVGVNGYLLSMGQARTWKKEMESKGVSLKALEKCPVDPIWGEDQPPPPDAKILAHPMEYAGKTVSQKLEDLRTKLKEKGARAILISALDEVAWLYNIRGGDVEFNPVVIAYTVVTETSATLFIDQKKLSLKVIEHLGPRVTLSPYEDVGLYLKKLDPGIKVLVDVNQTSMALASILPTEDIIESPSPLNLAKALKNRQELEGMRQAHIRDGAALVSFLAWLEKALGAGPEGPADLRGGLPWPLTEAAIATKLEEFRFKQPKFVSLSFATISAVGANGAIIHYKPHEDTSAPLASDSLLLLDSGAQFLDGTTDVTRTVHFGNPTPEEKQAFTLVLRGHIALAQARFPEGTMGNKLDILARLPLWGIGLDYKHGTGHGVGAFLNVHEGPQSISYKKRPYEEGLYPGMVTSNEPGYYADGRFGIRIENIIICNEALTPNHFGDVKYCEFETITMAPIQTKLIDPSLLNPSDKEWLNTYHKQVREALFPLLGDDALASAYLIRETEPII